MLRDSHKGGQPPEFGKLRAYLPATCVVTSAILTKLAKHLALLASLAILGEATGRVAVNCSTAPSSVTMRSSIELAATTAQSAIPPRAHWFASLKKPAFEERTSGFTSTRSNLFVNA